MTDEEAEKAREETLDPASECQMVWHSEDLCQKLLQTAEAAFCCISSVNSVKTLKIYLSTEHFSDTGRAIGSVCISGHYL